MIEAQHVASEQNLGKVNCTGDVVAWWPKHGGAVSTKTKLTEGIVDVIFELNKLDPQEPPQWNQLSCHLPSAFVLSLVAVIFEDFLNYCRCAHELSIKPVSSFTVLSQFQAFHYPLQKSTTRGIDKNMSYLTRCRKKWSNHIFPAIRFSWHHLPNQTTTRIRSAFPRPRRPSWASPEISPTRPCPSLCEGCHVNTSPMARDPDHWYEEQSAVRHFQAPLHADYGLRVCFVN